MRLSLLPALILPACSTMSYQRDFKEAAAAFPAPPSSAEGPWVGEWKSEVNGHHGPLWCIVRPNPERPGHFDFRYHAGWGILQFGDYTHTVAAALDSQGSLKLDDEMELPAGLGIYAVKGTVTPVTFDARYSSEHDRGTMVLRRPE